MQAMELMSLLRLFMTHGLRVSAEFPLSKLTLASSHDAHLPGMNEWILFYTCATPGKHIIILTEADIDNTNLNHSGRVLS